MGRWKEEMEVEFVKLSNRVEALEKLMQDAPLAKSFEQIQKDWDARYNTRNSPPDIGHFENKARDAAPKITAHDRSSLGPAPYNKPSFCED